MGSGEGRPVYSSHFPSESSMTDVLYPSVLQLPYKLLRSSVFNYHVFTTCPQPPLQ